MKKLIMLLAAIVISSGAFSQESKSYDSKAQEATKAKTSQQQDMKDNITMRGEKVWLIRDGKAVELVKDMTLDNGVVVSTTGLITYKNGTTRQMKSGETADMKGNMTVTAAPEKKDEKMEMEK